MPRKKKKKLSLRAYFYQQFVAHPEWLDLKDNSAILEQWKVDNPGEEASDRIRANLASLKSKLRADKRGGVAVPGKKRGPKPASASVVVVVASAAIPELEKLEMLIDESVLFARSLAVAKLEPVIKHLRVARAQIIMMFDPPS